jgi:hypothetical protein
MENVHELGNYSGPVICLHNWTVHVIQITLDLRQMGPSHLGLFIYFDCD